MIFICALNFQFILYFLGLFLFSLPLCASCLCMHIAFITSLQLTQSGSQLSVNQDSGDPLLPAGSPVVQTVTDPSITPHIASEDTPLPSSYTSPSCTPLPLELHIDEDGSSAPTSLRGSAVIIASSKSLQYSQIQQKDDGGTIASEISHMESFSVSSALKPLSPDEDNNPTRMLVTKVSASPGTTARSSSPVTVSKISSPILRAKISSLPEVKSESPVPKSHSPVRISPQTVTTSDSTVTGPTAAEAVAKTASSGTAPRLSSPVPKSASPVTVPTICSPLTIPKSTSPDPVRKSASYGAIPRLSSPVPRTASPLTVPNVSSSAAVPKSYSPEMSPRSSSPVTLPRLSSPVTVPKCEPVIPKSPATVIRKQFTVPGTSSPRASPVSLAAVPSSNLCATETQGGDVLDLTWPCRENLLDDALDKLLASDSTRLTEYQPPASVTSGDEDRSWEEEEGIYPDFSREGTLTPMTESSWMDECFTPSTCPGTPDATLDLPIQQPSAVERLSASGQVGNLTLPK